MATDPQLLRAFRTETQLIAFILIRPLQVKKTNEDMLQSQTKDIITCESAAYFKPYC